MATVCDAPVFFWSTLGFVAIVRDGVAVSDEALERITGIRAAFLPFFSTATGGVGSMTTPSLGGRRRAVRH